MKKIIILLLSCVSILAGYAQSDSTEYSKMFWELYNNPKIKQIRGKNNVYNVQTILSSLFVWNTKSVYIHVAPNYPSGFMEEIVLVNKDELTDYLNAHPIINNESTVENNCIRITMVSDLKGKIVEVYFMYEEAMNISLVELERVENEIKSRCRLSYKSMDSSPIQANYLDFTYYKCK